MADEFEVEFKEHKDIDLVEALFFAVWDDRKLEGDDFFLKAIRFLYVSYLVERFEGNAELVRLFRSWEIV